MDGIGILRLYNRDINPLSFAKGRPGPTRVKANLKAPFRTFKGSKPFV